MPKSDSRESRATSGAGHGGDHDAHAVATGCEPTANSIVDRAIKLEEQSYTDIQLFALSVHTVGPPTWRVGASN